MVERDVALSKIGLIDRAIDRIREVESRSDLKDLDAEELVILNLQRAAQASIDLAAHVIASEGWRLPESLGENFTILEERGVIPSELAAELRRMTGVRNVAVHTYESLDVAVVDHIVENHLDDMRTLCRYVIDRFGAEW